MQNRAALVSLLTGATIIVFALAKVQAEELPPDSWLMPFDVNQRHRPDNPSQNPPRDVTQRDIYEFMWQSFVAANWPQKTGGNRGEPDRKAFLTPWQMGDDESQGPTVWETYRRPTEVFTPLSDWPISWNDQSDSDPCPDTNNAYGFPFLPSSTGYSSPTNSLNQPFIHVNYPTGPVTDQNGNYLRYQVGLNQSFFSYIKHFKYYDARVQTRAVRRYIRHIDNGGDAEELIGKSRYFQTLPSGVESYLTELFDLPDYALQGIVEWKSTWKVLDRSDRRDRYYWRYMIVENPDGSCTDPIPMGLIALHLHRKTSVGHIAATFEQADNTQLFPEYSERDVEGAAPLPAHASLNPGGQVSPEYPNGYQICDRNGKNCESGRSNLIPKPIQETGPLPAPQTRPITNVVRAVSVPTEVEQANARWRNRLEGTVWFYYRMIGTQNKDLTTSSDVNGDLGPGQKGAQVSNTTDLINTALESYTQKGWSCARCHQNAYPQGVSIPFERPEHHYQSLHVMSFLLQSAQDR